MYNGYQTLVMHNPFSRYSETQIIHNRRLFIMSVTDRISNWELPYGDGQECIVSSEQWTQLSNLDNNPDSSHRNHLPGNIKIYVIKLAISSSSSCYILMLQRLFFIPHQQVATLTGPPHPILHNSIHHQIHTPPTPFLTGKITTRIIHPLPPYSPINTHSPNYLSQHYLPPSPSATSAMVKSLMIKHTLL